MRFTVKLSLCTEGNPPLLERKHDFYGYEHQLNGTGVTRALSRALALFKQLEKVFK